MAKQTFLIFLLMAVLTACTKAELTSAPTLAVTPAAITIATQEPSVTLTPLPTNTATATNTPGPTNTATTTFTPPITPTATPATPIWVEAGTLVPNSAVISPENATQVMELARWGRGVIKDIDLSADGRWVAVAAGSGVYIHDVQDLSVEPRAIEADGNVTAVSISPTGDKVALVIWGNELQVWQISPQKIIFGGSEARRVQFSPDGSVLAVVMEKDIELRDSNNGLVLESYGARNDSRIKFSPNGSMVAVWSESRNRVSVFDWRQSRLEYKKEVILHRDNGEEYHQPLIGDVVFMTENDLRFLVHEIMEHTFLTGRIEVQEAGDNKLLFSTDRIDDLAEPVKYVCNEPVVFWDPPEPTVPYHMEISHDAQMGALFYEDTGYGGDFAEYSSLRFHRVNGQQLYVVEEGIVDFEFSPDGQTWIAGLQDGRLQIRRLSDGSVLDSVDAYESPVLNTTVSPDDQWVGVVYVDEVKIYQRQVGTVLYHYSASEIAFDPDGKRFALGYSDGSLELRNISDGSLISAIRAHEDKITTVRYLPSGELLSAGFDCELILWQVPHMIRVGSLENVMVEGYVTEEQVPVRVRQFFAMPDGQSVIGQFLGGDFGVWSTEDGHLLRIPEPEHFSQILAISSDGKSLAVPFYRIPESWDSSLTLVGTEAGLASFSPDSSLLAGEQWEYGQDSSMDGALKLWAVSPMRLVHIAMPQTDSVTAVTFTLDGRLILTGALDGVVRLWGVP